MYRGNGKNGNIITDKKELEYIESMKKQLNGKLNNLKRLIMMQRPVIVCLGVEMRKKSLKVLGTT